MASELPAPEAADQEVAREEELKTLILMTIERAEINQNRTALIFFLKGHFWDAEISIPESMSDIELIRRCCGIFKLYPKLNGSSVTSLMVTYF